MTIALYGIPNCDTVKKARAWLSAKAIDYTFHDYKKVGVDPVALSHWIAAVGWEVLLNRQGTTFRKLPDADKADLNAGKATAIMLANPSAIRRPVVTHGETIVVGFDPDRYAALPRG